LKFLKEILCIILFAFFSVDALAAAPAPASKAPAVTADAAVVMDLKSGKVLYEKNANKREYPASLTKMMTCILSIEKGRPYQIIEISPNAVNVESTALNAGDWIRQNELRQQMMMISDNGAATAIAETIAGSVPRFASMMNEKAKAIGCTGTHFVNANGMPDPNHYTTAMDMARIAQYGMKNKEFRQIVSTKYKQIHYIRPATNFSCGNSNELLYSYPGCIGIKTGWTRAAAGCLAAAADKNGEELLVVVLHSATEDTRFSDARRLLDYGFSLKNHAVSRKAA
jgi:D-alanyl-D-alanine carboxypeptidase (penicillin-binding protein 5/6)